MVCYPFRSFNRRQWQISLPFYLLQLVKSFVYLKPEKKVPLPKDRIMEQCTIFEDCRTVDPTAKHTQETEIKFYSYYIYIIILLHPHFWLYNPPYKFICLSILSITSSSFKTRTQRQFAGLKISVPRIKCFLVNSMPPESLTITRWLVYSFPSHNCRNHVFYFKIVETYNISALL